MKKTYKRTIKKFGGIGSRTNINKNSKLYKMLTSKSVPTGNISFLVRDGKVTDEAKWLLLACDLEITFSELCVMAYVLCIYEELDKPGIFDDIGGPFLDRHIIYDGFGDHIKDVTVNVSLWKMQNMGLTYNKAKSMVSFKRNKADKFLKKHGVLLRKLYQYVDKEIGCGTNFNV